MTIKRYELYDDCSPYCEESEDGDFVKWKDVEPVIAERDALKAEVSRLESELWRRKFLQTHSVLGGRINHDDRT